MSNFIQRRSRLSKGLFEVTTFLILAVEEGIIWLHISTPSYVMLHYASKTRYPTDKNEKNKHEYFHLFALRGLSYHKILIFFLGYSY